MAGSPSRRQQVAGGQAGPWPLSWFRTSGLGPVTVTSWRFAAAIGVGVLGERLTAPAAAGAGLLLAALVLLARTSGGSGGTRDTR